MRGRAPSRPYRCPFVYDLNKAGLYQAAKLAFPSAARECLRAPVHVRLRLPCYQGVLLPWLLVISLGHTPRIYGLQIRLGMLTIPGAIELTRTGMLFSAHSVANVLVRWVFVLWMSCMRTGRGWMWCGYTVYAWDVPCCGIS